MRFIIDVCVGRILGEWLISNGHNVVYVRDKDSRMADVKILEWAYNENRILITLDKDFGYHMKINMI